MKSIPTALQTPDYNTYNTALPNPQSLKPEACSLKPITTALQTPDYNTYNTALPNSQGLKLEA
jgi:hypothetical protein